MTMNTDFYDIVTESVEAHQRSFDRGIQIGHQRRNKVRLVSL